MIEIPSREKMKTEESLEKNGHKKFAELIAGLSLD